MPTFWYSVTRVLAGRRAGRAVAEDEELNGRHHPSLGKDSGGIPAESFDRDYAGMPADVSGMLRVRRRSSRRRGDAARAAGLQGAAADRRDVRAARQVQAAAR